MDRQEACIQALMQALERITQAHDAYNAEVASAVKDAQRLVKLATVGGPFVLPAAVQS